jgi:hypothetical protein
MSIESKHGVDEPDYAPPERLAVEAADEVEPIGDSINLFEAIVSLVIPIAGLGLAIWRFGRNNVGPGIADLLLGGLGFVIAAIILTK